MSSPAVPLHADQANFAVDSRPVPARRKPVSRIVLLVVAALCLAAVVPIYRNGIEASPFPSYVAGNPMYQVERYSAPWIAGAIGLAGLAVLLLLVAAGPLFERAARRIVLGTSGARTPSSLGVMGTGEMGTGVMSTGMMSTEDGEYGRR